MYVHVQCFIIMFGYAVQLLSSCLQLQFNNIHVQYRSRVTYHLSSREKRDASREKRESLNRGVWNILLARSQCTLANG